jgi:protoporphyrinogen oxidase
VDYDYLIIGGGVSGVAIGRLLQLSGIENFLILEQARVPGGLCRTTKIGDHYLDVGGGHFLCTKHPEVYSFIFHHIPKSDFNDFERVSKISVEGQQVDYPLESNIWQLPPALCAEYLISVVQNGEARGLPPPENFEAWIRWKLGNRITDTYMLPYNRKIWGLEASEMDIDWLHKIPRLNLSEIVSACLARSSDRRAMPSHSRFYYPKAGGFQTVFDAMAAPVAPRLQCGEPVDRIERSGDVLLVNGRHRARRVINTAPWHSLADSPVLTPSARAAIGRLRASQLVVSLHEAPYDTKAHWVYEPDESLRHHRSFYIHNFAPHSSPLGFYRETNLKRWKAGQGEIFAETNPYAYPIPALGWAKAIGEVLAHCEPLGIHGLGRWGQWQYFNSDVCIFEAMRLAERLGHVAWRKPLGLT